MQQIPLAAAKREATGKGAARKMRAVGSVPAVIYGAGREPENLMVAIRDLQKVLGQVIGATAFLELSVEGEPSPRMAVIQEVQSDHLGRKLRHVDFYEVSADQELTLEVPLEVIGQPVGLEAGGVLSTAAYSVMIRGMVNDIPDTVQVDVSGLDVNDSVYIKDVDLPGAASIVFEDNYLVASCQMPAVVAEEEEEGEEGEEEAGEGAAEAAEEGAEAQPAE